MTEVLEFFQKLFDVSDFPPRWHCGHWSSFHGWLYIVSDLATWLAYFAIPVIILKYISRRNDARFSRIYFLFAAFILACGSTHLLDAVMFWHPYYRLNALMRFLTGIISWITVFSLIKLLPIANTLKSAEEMESEIELRKAAEQQLQLNNNRLIDAQEIARLGHWQWDVVENKVEWSDMTLRLYGFTDDKKDMSYEEYLQCLHPDDKEFVHQAVTQGFKTKVFPKFYHRVILPGGQVRTLMSRGDILTNSKGDVIKMFGTVQDITELIKTEHELLIKTQRLESSNLELQKFASIASHDMREPLRKILTFGSMLERSSIDRLDEKGRLYVNKITEAATRMQQLIDDVLDFSQLTTNAVEFEKLKLHSVISQVLADLEVAIETSKCACEVGQLPEIEGNAGQLAQLFQNLIGNAIKFRNPNLPPIIKITAEIITGSSLPAELAHNHGFNFTVIRNPEFSESVRFCKIEVEDNGIGFDEAYLDKIFLIFQRLHDRTEYEGTGIGLAIVKKVTELHSGYITARSKLGMGTTFTIILPVLQHVAD